MTANGTSTATAPSTALPAEGRVDWVDYAKGKVVHFVYFYVLWVTIQFGFKAPAFAAETGWSHAGLLWTVIDEFCARLVYIYSGYLFADMVFTLSDRARAHPSLALAGLGLWALVNGGLVAFGISEWPVVSLALGLAGACAIIVFGTLLARMNWLNVLRFCGAHSIVIYLAFFLPMAATRTLLLKTAIIPDIGTISLIVTIVGVVGALLIWKAALPVGTNFLFERPEAFWIAPKKARTVLQAAE